MPKIYIRGEKEPTIVSHEEATRILDQKNDPSHKASISVGLRELSKGQIKEVSFTDEATIKKYNLDNPADRETIRQFEVMLDQLKIETPQLKSIEYYGHPFKNERYIGWVTNELLGGVHWTIVEYALKNNLIARLKSGAWAVVAFGVEPEYDFVLYDDFRAKLNALGDLRGRREYAQSNQVTSQNQIVSQEREHLQESMKMPEEPMDLPF